MVLFLYGKDTFRSRQKLHEMVAKFKTERDPEGYNVRWFNLEKTVAAGTVIEELLATPFLASKKMIILESLLSSGVAQSVLGVVAERLQGGTFPDSHIIVFWEGTDAFKTKDSKALFDCLEKEKYVQVFDELAGAKAVSYISTEIQEGGGKATPQAVQYIAAHAGSDSWYLHSLIDQLIAYKLDQGEIEVSDVQIFLDEKVDDNIFNLVDGILSGQSKKVFAMIQEQYRIGQDVQYIFAMLVRQCRILLELRDLYEHEELNSDQLAKKLSLHPFVVKKSLPMVKQHSLASLQSLYRYLLEFDIETKTGYGSPETLFDVLVGKFCLSTK
jgi:DNA polymerase-3 subunit delta